MGRISIDDFKKLDLRVAEILEVERVPGTDKLYKLKIDLGNEQREIVSGIADYYSPEELKGKKIVVLANLEPKVIRGVKSDGMLLAAEKEGKLALLTVDREIENGTPIH